MTAAGLAIAALAGAGVGALYFTLLWLSVERLTRNGGGLGFAALAVLRLVLVIVALAVFVAAARTLPELGAAFAGFLMARLAATRAMKPRER